ncbi:unnamed protein product [Rotaria magnacalcarata]|uniref:Uncharacterized protein n=1 Tax=Rotaria magnacalcarata TaxID=392030 RepID=A0A818YID2_9BILA|nr:unnamed protein product [Rotaria magnacalcarata]
MIIIQPIQITLLPELNLHQKRHRSIDESNVLNILQLNESLEITYSKFIENLNYTNQYLLALSKIDDLIGSLSVTSDRNHSKNLALANHLESSEDDKSKPTKKNIILSPIGAVILPKDGLYIIQ